MTSPSGPPLLSPWPPPSTPMGVVFAPGPAPHPTLPLAAGLGAIGVLVASLVAARFVLDWVVDFRWPIVAYIALLAAVGYGPSLIWWRYASHRWGSGHMRRDVGLTPRWSDLGWGPLIWFATVMVQVVAALVVVALDVPTANNTDGIGELAVDRTYAVSIVITAVVAAPFVEEVVFRGLVLRSLLSAAAPWVAIGVQGVVFGVVHIDPARGAGNIGLAMVLSGVGISLGVAAYLLRRIGPTIVAHAILNAIVMTLVLTGVADRLAEENSGALDGDRRVVEQVAVVDQADIVEPHGGGDAHPAR